mmetsp:Transcript_37691/g.42004  ORF Transcript_37691/g.42004 Transcript_37691/m.42004 type:complete len:215 (+) Transcript_37691:1271-1915(+)
MIPLCRQNRFQTFHNIFFGHKPHMIGGTGERRFLVVRSSHPTTDHDIKPFQFTLLVHNDDTANIIGINIERIITGHRDTNFKLAGQIPIPIQRFARMIQNNPASTIIRHRCINLKFLPDFLAPDFCGGDLFPIQPQFRKGGGHGTKEVGKDFGIFSTIRIIFRDERCRGRHDIPIDIATGPDGRPTQIHNTGNDSLQTSFHDAMELKTLSDGRP